MKIETDDEIANAAAFLSKLSPEFLRETRELARLLDMPFQAAQDDGQRQVWDRWRDEVQAVMARMDHEYFTEMVMLAGLCAPCTEAMKKFNAMLAASISAPRSPGETS